MECLLYSIWKYCYVTVHTLSIFFVFNNLLEKHTKESAATANDSVSDEDEDQCQSVSKCFWLTILQSALVSKQTVWGKSIFLNLILKMGIQFIHLTVWHF